MDENYFIKPDYQINEKALTFDSSEGANTYWTDARTESAAYFQYHVYEKASQILKDRACMSVMDVGCGPPIKTKVLLAPFCDDIVLVDQPSISHLSGKILPQGRFVPANLEVDNLDLFKKFDLIVCADVLEHLMNPDYCANLIKRHLSKSGIAVISTPERDNLRGRLCDFSPQPEHVREWNSKEFIQYLTSRGFDVVEHFCVPQKRVSRIEFLSSRVLGGLVRKCRWSSCQVAVCRLAPESL